MNSVQKHLQKIKNFASPSVHPGINKLYLLEVKEKPGLIKVGDTSQQTVSKRNQQTCTNASLHRTNPITYWLALKEDGTEYRDYEVHAFLTSKGYVREDNDQGNVSEWFYITEEEFLEAFEEFIGFPIYHECELRPAQHYLLEQIQEAIDEGHQYINAGFCVRVGKTIISLTVAERNGWMPVYIGKNLTSQNSAEDDNNNFGIVDQLLTQSLHGVDELETDDVSKKTKQIIKNIKKANTENKPIVFYVDEVDDASHTKRSRDIITPVVEHFKRIKKFGCIITMSGTRIFRGEKILKELTKDPIKELALEYYEMQVIQPDTTVNRNYRHISFYTSEDDGLASISDAMKNKNHGHKSLATVVETLLGTNNFDIEINDDYPHWFMKFSTVGKSNANALVRYLNRNCSVIENKEHHFQTINGDVTKSKDAQDFCKKVIANHPDKICIFITQGMATTSFSVKSIGNSVVFTDNELTSDDIQGLHRSATWNEGKEECNMLVVTTNDSTEHSFADIFEDETKMAKTRGEKEELYRELLDNNSMIHYTNGGALRVPVTIENIAKVLDTKAKSMTKVASLMTVVNDLDEEILNKILYTFTASKGTSIKSKSTKGDKFNPFGDTDEEKEKKKKQMDKMTIAKKEKILRNFVENAINIPAVAREQETTIEEFDFWDEFGIPEELFLNIYENSWPFKDRIDTIYGLCEDEEYLITNYINGLTV